MVRYSEAMPDHRLDEHQVPPLINIDVDALRAYDLVSLTTLGSRWDCERLGISLAEGLRLRAFDLDTTSDGVRDHLVADGVVQRWSKEDGPVEWVMRIESLAHESDLADRPDHWAHQVDWEKELRTRADWIATQGRMGELMADDGWAGGGPATG